jgi:hypothetical protein
MSSVAEGELRNGRPERPVGSPLRPPIPLLLLLLLILLPLLLIINLLHCLLLLLTLPLHPQSRVIRFGRGRRIITSQLSLFLNDLLSSNNNIPNLPPLLVLPLLPVVVQLSIRTRTARPRMRRRRRRRRMVKRMKMKRRRRRKRRQRMMMMMMRMRIGRRKMQKKKKKIRYHNLITLQLALLIPLCLTNLPLINSPSNLMFVPLPLLLFLTLLLIFILHFSLFSHRHHRLPLNLPFFVPNSRSFKFTQSFFVCLVVDSLLLFSIFFPLTFSFFVLFCHIDFFFFIFFFFCSFPNFFFLI